jgi:hypothetical protein
VVLADSADRPILVRRRVGAGALYLGTLPVEYFGAVRPDANLDDDVWRLYRALAVEAGVRPLVRVNSPDVTVDCVVHEDGTRYAWLISLVSSPRSIVPDTAGRLIDVRTGEDLTARCDLPPYGVRVARCINS